MSTEENALTRRYRKFVDLAPLTVAIAGLPPSDGHVNYNVAQMEIRAHTIAAAYKLAQAVMKQALEAE